MLGREFWSSINMKVVARYREAIFDDVGSGKDAKDVYGNEYNVDLNVLTESIVLEESGERTYLLQISSPGAYGIGLNFDQFYS